MKIAQLNDTHIGITTEGQLEQMFRSLQKEEFDVLVHNGDYCGTRNGTKCIRRTLRIIREFFPTKPIVSTIGNHDYWCHNGGQSRPSALDFYKNLQEIEAAFREHGVHYLDVDGIYRHPAFEGIELIGVSGWYNNPNPPTNDELWLPIGLEGDTNRTLLKATEEALWKHAEGLTEGSTVVFVSHFPVINTGNDYKGSFATYSWDPAIAEHFMREYGCRYFLCGHAHQSHKGPLRYESGSDYGKPKYQIIDIQKGV